MRVDQNLLSIREWGRRWLLYTMMLFAAQVSGADELQEIMPGYYVYVHTDDAPGVSSTFNSGVIVTDEGVVVVDALQSEDIAREVRSAIAEVTDQPIRYLISSTFHGRYTGGNPVYEDVFNIAHEYYREDLIRSLADASPDRRAASLPDQTYADRVTLHLGGKEIRILHWGPAHTRGDTIVFVPEDRIVYMSEVFNHDEFPYSSDGYLGDWMKALEAAEALEADIFVPGHGFMPDDPLETRQGLRGHWQMLANVRDAVQQEIENGATEDEAVANIDFPEYHRFKGYSRAMPIAVRRAYAELTTGLTNGLPNPYRAVPNWLEPLESRDIGSVSTVYPDADGNIWVAERCGENSCIDHDSIAPILLLDSSGRLLASFGQGLFAFPHGVHVDPDGNVWVTDARAGAGRGHQVIKFNPDGEVLMTLGEAGVAGDGPGRFNGPTDVVVAPNGDVFVADGHETDSNNRIVKFSGDGRFIRAWGRTGSGAGEFDVPHAIAMDSTGRVFVADRNNNRIQIFDQEGEYLDEWTQFGRPSGLFIAADDTIYVSDNQSNDARNPGWHRGIYVGSVQDGSVVAFIPDPEFDATNSLETSAHGIAADADGNIYGAEVWSQTIKKYVR